MSYTSILVHLDTDYDSSSRVKYAAELANELGSYLIGFAASSPRPLAMVNETILPSSEELAHQDERNRARLADAKKLFFSLAGDDQNVSWRCVEGPTDPALLVHARSADLIVSGTPHGVARGDYFQASDPANLLHGAGRPVLLASETAHYRRPKTVIVGWKDTTESRRALLDALPMMKLADSVQVVTITEGVGPSIDEDLSDVVRHLMRNGVEARPRLVEADGNPADQFLEIARDHKVDLVVAGAYGHSRLREWIFGGFTRSLLNESRLNRLMTG